MKWGLFFFAILNTPYPYLQSRTYKCKVISLKVGLYLELQKFQNRPPGNLLLNNNNRLKIISQLCFIMFNLHLTRNRLSNWVRQGDESESSKMVLKQVKWAYFDAYLWQTMWNHAKKSMEESKHSDFQPTLLENALHRPSLVWTF